MAGVSHPVGARIVEASSRLIPNPGVTVEQMLEDAQITGAEQIIHNDDGSVTVIWFKEQ